MERMKTIKTEFASGKGRSRRWHFIQGKDFCEREQHVKGVICRFIYIE